MKTAKLAIIGALVVFIASSVGYAGGPLKPPPNNNVLQGTYAMTGTGNCLHSDAGFKAATVAEPRWLNSVDTGAFSYSASLLIEGTIEFKSDGTGTFVGLNSASVFAGGVNPFPAEMQLRRIVLGTPDIPLVVAYQISEGSIITGTVTDPTSGSVTPIKGRVSEDRRMIMFNTVNAFTIADDGTVPLKVVCNVGRFLMKID